MGTNYYRIPTAAEMEKRLMRLQSEIRKMEMSPENIEREFRYLDFPDNPFTMYSPWDVFTDRTKIHLGKRSGGWQFCWNFHKNTYYSNKEELIKFVKSGRVVDEYGALQNNDEFLNMAFTWCLDGLTFDEKYERGQQKKNPNYRPFGAKYYDTEVDGLRISNSTDFS